MFSNVDVSVIVPIYNVEEYLKECLDSLLRQGDISLEVVMIDDGATDSSGIIADEYAEKYPQFKCYHIENGGLGHARNYGAQLANGKYIIFLDSDDIVPDFTYYKMFVLAEKHDAEMTICNVDRFNSSGVKPSYLHKKAFFDYQEVTHITKNHYLLNDTVSVNKLIRKDFFDRNHFAFPENILYEDIPVTIPMHFMCDKVAMMKETGYLWRVRDGGSKSITQNAASMKNLNDRLTIMRRLDDFFKENVTDEEILIDKQYKHLDVDLKVFVNKCATVPEEDAYEILKKINEYIDEAIGEEAFEKLSLIDKQRYIHVRNNDLQGLIELLGYSGYNSEPLTEEDNRLLVDLPEEIFSFADRDVTEEFKRNTPFVKIERIKAKTDSFEIIGHLFWPRFDLHPGEQKVKAFLSNYKNRIELTVEPNNATYLTKRIGKTVAPYSGKEGSYDYDGSGFKITINAEDIKKNHVEDGLYHIDIEYCNRLFNGCEILKNIKDNKKNKIDQALICFENSVARLALSQTDELNLLISNNVTFLEDIQLEENRMILLVSRSIEKLYLMDISSEKYEEVEKTGDCSFTVNINGLKKSNSYTFVLDTTGPEYILTRTEDTRYICGNTSLIAGSDKTRIPRITLEDSFTIIEEVSLQDKKALLKAFRIDPKRNNSVQFARLITEDKYSEEMLCIAEAHDINTTDESTIVQFDVDLTERAIESRLYEGERPVFVEYIFEDGETSTEPIYCKELQYRIKAKRLVAALYNDTDSKVRLKAKQVWPKSENSKLKRAKRIKDNYPEYKKEPIVDNRILFESMWGSKYSCNPRAIYEYIDEKYPEYECIWALEDARIPINGKGKRVRWGSLEYYYYLATSKYLVNNVNFPNQYEKREGQIEIQTMHGTPLKTLGLDVPGELSTQKDIDLFVERNKRWNYLVTQGKFVEDKASQMFGVKPEMLKTGYPRTDKLINADKKQVDELKQKMGLPRDKKVILYAPTWRVRNRFDMQLDLEAMREALSDEYILLIRIHYFSSSGYEIPEDRSFIYDFNKYGSIEDLYLIADIMITDYSSSMFDYALLDKPMIFFVYDIEEYCDKLRGLYVDFKNEAPGPMCMNSQEVINAIEHIDEEIEKCKDRVDAFKEKFLTYETGNSTEQVVMKAIRPESKAHTSSGAKQKRSKLKRLIKKLLGNNTK